MTNATLQRVQDTLEEIRGSAANALTRDESPASGQMNRGTLSRIEMLAKGALHAVRVAPSTAAVASDFADRHDIDEVRRVAELVRETQPIWAGQLLRVAARAEAHFAPSSTRGTDAATLTIYALERMMLSCEEDIRNNHGPTVSFLQGELKGYRNAKLYLTEALRSAAPSATGAYDDVLAKLREMESTATEAGSHDDAFTIGACIQQVEWLKERRTSTGAK